MGLVRADWHLPTVEMDTSDPFEIPQRPEGDQKSGASPQVADPRRPGGDGLTLLNDLILEEAVLDARGVTCHLKDRDWTHPSCSSCPERGDAARAELCRVGLAQEKVLAEVRVGG